MSNRENFTRQKASGEHSQLREGHIRGHRNKRRAGVFRTLQVLQQEWLQAMEVGEGRQSKGLAGEVLEN